MGLLTVAPMHYIPEHALERSRQSFNARTRQIGLACLLALNRPAILPIPGTRIGSRNLRPEHRREQDALGIPTICTDIAPITGSITTATVSAVVADVFGPPTRQNF